MEIDNFGKMHDRLKFRKKTVYIWAAAIESRNSNGCSYRFASTRTVSSVWLLLLSQSVRYMLACVHIYPLCMCSCACTCAYVRMCRPICVGSCACVCVLRVHSWNYVVYEHSYRKFFILLTCLIIIICAFQHENPIYKSPITVYTNPTFVN